MNWTVELIFTLNNSHLYVKIRVSTKHFQQLRIHDDTTYCISKVFSSLREIENFQIKKTVGTSHGIIKKNFTKTMFYPMVVLEWFYKKVQFSFNVWVIVRIQSQETLNWFSFWCEVVKKTFFIRTSYIRKTIKDRFLWIVIKT